LTRHLTYFGAKLSQTPLVLNASAGNLIVQNSASLTVSGGSGGGALGFTSTTPTVCSVSATGQLFALLPGECTVVAIKAASGIYADTTSPSLTITINATVPSAPFIGTATAVDPNSATVTFSAPSFDGGSPITSYEVFSTPTGITGISTSNSANSITVTGLTPGTTYSFTVVAINSVGSSLASDLSNTVSTSVLNGSLPPIVKIPVSSKLKKIGVVYFGRSTSAFDHNGYLALAKVLAKFMNKKIKTIYLTGYADASIGLDNKLLSLARAERVHAFLIVNHIKAKYVVKAEAATHLVAPGRTADQLNRRVEIWAIFRP